MLYIVIGLVVAAILVAVVVVRSREPTSPLKTVSEFRTGLEKISPQAGAAAQPPGGAQQDAATASERGAHAEDRPRRSAAG